MATERPTLAERFDRAGIGPHQREASGATVVLCELVEELIAAVTRQSMLLNAALVKNTAIQAGQTRGAGQPAGAAAPSGEPEGNDQEGAQVQLREPGLPPVDPDDEPAKPGSDRALAEPSTPPAAAGDKPATKTTAKKATPAKAAAATRPRRPGRDAAT